MKTIEYYVKNVYGKETMYAADDEVKQTIYILTGEITITLNTINGLKRLGFDFKQVMAPVRNLQTA